MLDVLQPKNTFRVRLSDDVALEQTCLPCSLACDGLRVLQRGNESLRHSTRLRGMHWT